jgi:glycogen synthase
MKIVLIVSSYAPNTGGLQTVTRQLARELLRQGHQVTVLTNRYPRSLVAREVLDQMEVIRWHFLTPRVQQLRSSRFDLFLAGLLYFPLTLALLVLFLRSSRPDVVNVHFVGAPALFVLIARWFTKFRLVVSLHGDDVEGLSGRPRFDRWVFRSLLRRADVVTACSRYLIEKAKEFAPLERRSGRVIYNGIERMEVPIVSGKKHGVVAAGRFFPAKGFDVLLQAHARREGKRRLTLIGDGPERENLERLAGTLGLNGDITFGGKQDRTNVLREIASAELVAIPSRSESFCIVALEAMAMGKPVVASRVGGLPEVLAGADALLVEPDNVTELSAAIETVLMQLRSNPQFGARNRERAEQFSIDRMSNNYLEAYRA